MGGHWGISKHQKGKSQGTEVGTVRTVFASVCMWKQYGFKGGCNMRTVQEISGGECGSWGGYLGGS